MEKDIKYQLILLDNPIIISDEKLTFFKGYCYGTNVNNDWKIDVHGCASSDLGWSHPKVIAGYKDLPYIDYSNLSDEEMIKIGQIEKLAMEKLKYKWSHLYQFGYPKLIYPSNYLNELNSEKVEIYESLLNKKNNDNILEALKHFAAESGSIDGDIDVGSPASCYKWTTKYIESLSEPKKYDVEVEINENFVRILKLL